MDTNMEPVLKVIASIVLLGLKHEHSALSCRLWVVKQHTAQFIAGVRLHIRVAQATHLIPCSQMEILNGIFGIMETFTYGTKKQIFQACTRGIINPLQDLCHCLQRGSGAVGQSFPQIKNLNHRQDAEFFRKTGAP